MSISKWLFGEWLVVDRAPCMFNVRALVWDSDVDGEIVIEQNNKTGYKRAFLVGYNKHPISIQEAQEYIKSYRMNK